MADASSLVSLTSDIVAAYVSANKVAADEVPAIVTSVYSSLSSLGKQEPVLEALKPLVSIKKSITPEYLISLEDGRQYKSLKRHLAGRGMTPAEYRDKWGLPRDYPMVSPNYATQRSELAKKMGLGRKAGEKRPAKKVGRPRKGS